MSILTLGSQKEKKGNFQSKRKQKKKRNEIPNQRVGESKKKRKEIPNQRMGESKKGKERKFLKEKTEGICREVFGPDNI